MSKLYLHTSMEKIIMNDSLVLQLQRLSLDESTSISNLLRKAYFVARKLNITDVKDFLSKELNGYSEDDHIAPFRIMKGDLVAHDGKKEIDIELNTSHLVEFNFCRSPIHTLEEVYKHDPSSDVIYTKITDEKMLSKIQSQIREQDTRTYSNIGIIESESQKQLFEMMRPQYKILLKISKLKYNHIFNTLRAFISEWSIQLEEQGYTDENFQFTKEVGMSINNNYNINTVNSIIGDINNSTVNQSNDSDFKGNDALLRESLQKHHVHENDINEISTILKQVEPPKEKNHLPLQVNNWLKKMVGKSIDGTWEIGVATAGSVLSQIICLYFGLM